MEDSDLSPIQRLKIKSRMGNLINYISCYELTEKLLDQLKRVSPDMYNEIDGIRDKRGRPTDVYIKLIPRERARVQLQAVSFFRPASIDEDAHLSEYGEYSVSVDIWIADNALQLLCHELGHVKYVVPNLARYSKFYNKHYRKPGVDFSHIGHDRHDESGESAKAFEKRFFVDKANYLRDGGKKLESTFSILQKIKKNNRNFETNHLSRTAGPLASY